jgi:hypothetical protein
MNPHSAFRLSNILMELISETWEPGPVHMSHWVRGNVESHALARVPRPYKRRLYGIQVAHRFCRQMRSMGIPPGSPLIIKWRYLRQAMEKVALYNG